MSSRDTQFIEFSVTNISFIFKVSIDTHLNVALKRQERKKCDATNLYANIGNKPNQREANDSNSANNQFHLFQSRQSKWALNLNRYQDRCVLIKWFNTKSESICKRLYFNSVQHYFAFIWSDDNFSIDLANFKQIVKIEKASPLKYCDTVSKIRKKCAKCLLFELNYSY